MSGLSLFPVNHSKAVVRACCAFVRGVIRAPLPAATLKVYIVSCCGGISALPQVASDDDSPPLAIATNAGPSLATIKTVTHSNRQCRCSQLARTTGTCCCRGTALSSPNACCSTKKSCCSTKQPATQATPSQNRNDHADELRLVSHCPCGGGTDSWAPTTNAPRMLSQGVCIVGGCDVRALESPNVVQRADWLQSPETPPPEAGRC